MAARADTDDRHADLELALRITERIRSSLDLAEVLQQTVLELGEAVGASRCMLQLEPGGDGTCLMVEWDRGDTSPLGYRPPTPIARRIFASGGPLVIADVGGCDDGEIVEYLRAVGTAAAVNYPVLWHGRVLAVLGFEDDKPRDWQVRAVPLLERVDSQVAAALAQAELWEQQRRALAELENLNRLREELIANVSHELRTPLAAVVGAVKTLRRRDVRLADAEVERLFDVLEDQTQRLNILAEDVLDLARFHTGEARLVRRPTTVSEVVERTISGLRLAEGREVRVELDGDAPISVDPHRLAQVVTNLLVNAVRHGSGEVVVSGGRVDGEAVIAVSDEGGGIAEDYREEMFEPFSHRSERSDSSGLGLSIARRIVEAHGGRLSYEPPGDGRRHRFVIRLPDAERR